MTSSVRARTQSARERVVAPRAARPNRVPATAPAMPDKAAPSGDASRLASATPPAAPIASRTKTEAGMRRSGANGILSPAISARAAAVARVRALRLAGIQATCVRLNAAAQINAAPAVMLRIPVTKPMPNGAQWFCIMLSFQMAGTAGRDMRAPSRQPGASVSKPGFAPTVRLCLFQGLLQNRSWVQGEASLAERCAGEWRSYNREAMRNGHSKQ